MATVRRKYTHEMKLNAVHLVQIEGRWACDVSDEIGIEHNTLYAWLRAARNSKLTDGEPAHDVMPEQSAISRPRVELGVRR